MRGGGDFMFESAEIMDYELHKVSLKRGGWNVESQEWSKNKGATINPKKQKR